MSIIDRISKAATQAIKKVNKDNTNNNSSKHWEETDLNELSKTVKENKKWNEEHSKSGWTNPQTGQKFSADYYKKNADIDTKALDRVQKEIKKRKLIKGLKDREKRISNDIKYRKRDYIDDELEQ
jgi:hypothetical protein